MKFEIIPVYLRSLNWAHDFENLKNAVEANDVQKIVIGDHNARIGEDQIIGEQLLEGLTTIDVARISNDKVINANGRNYLEFANNNGLAILNGRTLGDEDGNITFANKNGSSVIDFCAMSYDMLDTVQSFKVNNQIWSDHFPLCLALEIKDKGSNESEKRNLLPKLVWKNSQKETYREKLNYNLDLMDPNASLYDYIKLIRQSDQSKTGPKKLKFKNKWFDKDCRKLRTKTMRSLRAFRKTHQIADREKYANQKKIFQKLCKQKRKEYYLNIERKLNYISDSKSWWALAKEIRQKENQINCNINAEQLKDYFDSLLNQDVCLPVIYYAANEIKDEKMDSDFTLMELKQQLNKVKENKAPGEDRVPYEYFKHATDEFLMALVNVFTKILNGMNDFNMFRSGVIYPIHKKGDVSLPSNYRGITFMNCVGKLMIGMLNSRVTEWVNQRHILNEYQAGFRKGYSTVDNVFNLVSIVNIKLAEYKKVYAFFVDFKAAFDRVPRKHLIYKLYTLGLPSKIIRFIEKVYENTKSAVWTGEALSDHFETRTGVKQGCLLSPILFALYLNDMHECLGGGLNIDEINIRLLMYADDIVIIADDPQVLQGMINNLASYCNMWGMEVNQSKSEVMVFRNGGRLAASERWFYNAEELRITNEYKYLGITLTPKVSFTKHLKNKNEAAKTCINATWKNFIGKPNITLSGKWKMFLSVCRSIQSYGSQIWGNAYFDDVDQLYRYFIKRVLKLPENTPNYIIALETGYEPGYIYTYTQHLKYVAKVYFEPDRERLTHKLAVKIMEKNISWYKHLIDHLELHNIEHNNMKLSKYLWCKASKQLINVLQIKSHQEYINKSQESQRRIYKFLNYTLGFTYCNEQFNQMQIGYIMRARADVMGLNGSRYGTNEQLCAICNLGEVETAAHFIGRCPIFSAIRMKFFYKHRLSDGEVIHFLNGGEDICWFPLYNYLREALSYRKELINEYNY